MYIKMKMKEIVVTKVISCGCFCCELHLSYFDDDKDVVFLSFWVPKWDAVQGTIFSILWNRIKLAFKVLINGDYFLHELLVDRKDVSEIRDMMDKFLKD